tara:strand:+ start:1742 stop:2221 length:480 start_codon:yes stop_codon:yes gene_type:complete
MAFTGSNALCTSFKKELLEGVHNFKNSGGNTFKLALFTNSQAGNDNLGGSGTDMDGTVTAYSSSASNEVGNSGDYSAGGGSLTRVDPTTSGTTAFTDFSDLTFGSTTITARGALIYNDTASGDPAVCILDFGSNKSSTSGNFTIVFPTADSSNAIIRIA